MKEIDNILKLLIPDNELNIVKRQEIEYMVDEVLRPHPNHPTFEIDLVAKEIRVADLEVLDSVNFLNWREEIKEQKVIKTPNCVYVSALNIQNCRKKLSKINKEISKYPFISEEKVLSLHKNRKVLFLRGKN